MNFKHWLISEEIFPNKTATVYHRTRSLKDVSGILTSDFKAGAGAGCSYGCGLYTTYKIESQFVDYMEMYGEALVKFKVTDLDKYLIFQLSEAKQIHGNDYKISSQFKKLGLLNKPNVNESKLEYYDKRQEKEKFSSVLAYEFYEQNNWIEKSVKGIIYYGSRDGYCLVKYPTVQDKTITMLGYAVAKYDDMKKMEELKSNIGWIKSVGILGTPIKNVYKSPIENKEKFAFGDYSEIENVKNIFLTSKNLEKTAKKLGLYLDKFSDENISGLLHHAEDKDKMAEVIAKYKTELTDWNVFHLLHYATDKDKIAELIIKYKTELTDENVENLLRTATNKDKIAELIVKNKPELSNMNIYSLIQFATDKQDKIAELIIEKKSKLSGKHVELLLRKATDKDKIAELIIGNKPELSYFDVQYLLNFANDKEKIAERLQEKEDNISKLDDQSVIDLFHDDANDKDKIAQIINKYHTKKTPKIQEFIDKYSSGYKLNLGKKVLSTGSFT
jgi:hypothetical protein